MADGGVSKRLVTVEIEDNDYQVGRMSNFVGPKGV